MTLYVPLVLVFSIRSFISSIYLLIYFFFFFSSRRRHTRCGRDWSSDVCSSDLMSTHITSFKRFFSSLYSFVVIFVAKKNYAKLCFTLLSCSSHHHDQS